MSSGLHAFAPDHARDFAAIGDFLAKPFETDEVMAALARTVCRSQPETAAMREPGMTR